MKSFWILLLALTSALTHAKVNVVATLPDFGAIAQVVGGDHVKATTIARGTEDPHFVDARPSFIRVLNQADLLIESGADMEIGWLPPLVNAARNGKILGSGPGHLVLATHIPLIDVPKGPIDRSMGDVHSAGNPHFWLDPENGKVIARKIAEALGRIDPVNAAAFDANAEAFITELSRRMVEWEKRMAPHRGTKIISYHRSFDYFARRFGLEIVNQLEPKPGIEPSAVHITRLVSGARDSGVKLIVIEPFRPRRKAAQAADAIGAKLLVLPDKVGATEKANDYPGLFEELTRTLSGALAGAK